MFPPPELSIPGQLLLITDELPSPADFLLHKALFSHLKSTNEAKCILLGVNEDYSRWNSIAAKSVSIPTSTDISQRLNTISITSYIGSQSRSASLFEISRVY